MDINLSYSVSNEDLVGVLRTIWLFLENLNFSTTSAVLQTECLSKGYRDVTALPAKVVVVTPAAVKEKTHQANQTDYTSEAEGTYNLESSVHDVSASENCQNSEPFYVYYTDVENFSNEFFSETGVDQRITEVKISENFRLRNKFRECHCEHKKNEDNTNKLAEKPDEQPNLSPALKEEKSSTKRSPNTIESEVPSKILSKQSKENQSKENLNENLRKSRSNPNLKEASTRSAKDAKSREKSSCTNSAKPCSSSCEQDIDTIDNKELKKRFRQLQKEHQKLMGVTTELTTALQTHILGQSENLNSVLNNCKNIYPDLFKSGSPSNKQHSSSESSASESNKLSHEIISFRVISNHNVQTSTTEILLENTNNSKASSQNVRSVSSAPNTSSKTILSESSEGDTLKGVSSQNIEQSSSTAEATEASLKKTSQTLSEDVSSQTVQQSELSSEILTRKLSNENEIKSVASNSNSKYSCERVLTSKVSSGNISKDDNLGGSDIPSTEVIVEINKITNDISSATILAPPIKRVRSSSILLTTTNYENAQKPKVLLRRHSSKSCDESFLEKPLIREKRTSVVTFQPTPKGSDPENLEIPQRLQTADRCTSTEDEDSNTTSIEKNNVYQVNYAICSELPEIYVTTDNLAKVKQTPILTSESNCGSPKNRYFELDFKKLKKDLLNGEDDLKLALIQALRWEGIARLVNTFASLTLGREYLCQDDDLLISLLVPLIIGTHYSKVKTDAITLDMLMATLQKMSLRNRQRLRMISAGLVEHLVGFLSGKHSTISAYCMEYATALFMNLCLHHEARERLHSVASDVVHLLVDLLNTKHHYCLPYINGAMYSLLGDSYINQEAQHRNFAKAIEECVERTDGEMRRQLKFILKLHLTGPGENDCGCDPNIEPENEVDLLEPELDSDDTSYNKQPAGEDVLKKYKLLFPVYGSQVYATHLKCLCRAVTPMPRSTKQSDHSRHLVSNSDDAATMRSHGAMQEIPVKCKCFSEKATQSGELCSCGTNKNCTSTKKAKRGGSEPLTNLKSSSENITKGSVSEQPSRFNSPDMSFCEETQQFYYIPSVKTGIFESQKTKKLHRVAPSFTRTIPLPMKTERPRCNNTYCPQPFTKTMAFTPKESSSVKNPPFALDYSDCLSTCYRETYLNQRESINVNNGSNCDCYRCTNVCPNCSKRNKYACNCYNVIRGFVDETSQDNINNNSHIGNNSDNNNKVKTCQCNINDFATAHQNLCHNCQNSKTLTTQGPLIRNYDKSNHASTTTNPNSSNANATIVNFSYGELLTAINSDGRIHVCSNPEVECRCYDEVFQSRPKILRTPP